ncbi:MAG TPA: dihydrolipoamide acetyltransferase family protein [Solirubrobacterales bacterium]|nr:dihydrolipoamide acetyltransferase family protein [Solirubrobacterales bacterium]
MSETGAARHAATRTQKTIARRMSAAHAAVPDFALEADVDMEAAAGWREARRGAGEGAPSYNAMIVKACGIALRAHPKANASWIEDGFELHDEVNVGVAVAGDGSLVVPVVRGVDLLTVAEIGSEVHRLATAVRERRITLDQLSGATFTVSNLGMFGVDRFNAMVDLPQAAILAVGAIARRPVADRESVAIHRQMTLTLSCDHRVLYGAEGAEFLASVRDALEDPARLDEAERISTLAESSGLRREGEGRSWEVDPSSTQEQG